jgi:hypothetical protein
MEIAAASFTFKENPLIEYRVLHRKYIRNNLQLVHLQVISKAIVCEGSRNAKGNTEKRKETSGGGVRKTGCFLLLPR